MTNPAIAIELYLGGGWVDISAKVRRQAGITVTRGRANEQASPSPGTLVFTVDNIDGRFTIGKTDGPYGATFRRWVPVRYTAAGSRRFTGYIASAPVTWESGSRKLADVTITCIDQFGMMAMSPLTAAWADELIGSLGPLYWWRLADSAGAAIAAPSANSTALVGSVTQSGSTAWALDQVLAFGASPAEATEVTAAVEFKMVEDGSSGCLHTPGALSLPSEVTILVVYTPPESTTGNGYNVAVLGDPYLFPSWAAVSVRASDRAVQFLNPATVYATSLRLKPGEPVLLGVTIRSNQMQLLNTGDLTPTGSTPVGKAFWLGAIGTAVWSGTFADDRPLEGSVSEAVILSGAMTTSAFADLQAKMMGGGTAPASTWLNRAIASAGISGSVVAVGDDPQMRRPQLKGSNPAEIGEALAKASGSLFVTGRDGSLQWLDWSYCPARVNLDSARFSGDSLTWDIDDGLYYTDVVADGVTLASTSGWPRRALDIGDLVPATSQRRLLDWLIHSADAWGGPRLSGIHVNLMPFDAALTATYLALDLKSRIFPTGLPAQLPTPWVASIEGYTETLTESAWTITFNTAPDPAFVLDDDVAGVLDSDYRLAP